MTRRGRRMRVRPGTLLPVMPSLLLLFLLGSTSALLHAPRLAPRRARTRTAAAAAAPAAEEIAAVRVCMGNLCRCQDEAAGGGAEALLAALRARAPLPYPIEEDPCLGACGQGAGPVSGVGPAQDSPRVISDCHFRKIATEYDRKAGIKWLSCTEK